MIGRIFTETNQYLSWKDAKIEIYPLVKGRIPIKKLRFQSKETISLELEERIKEKADDKV
jgi:hypothetical protein